MPDQNLDLSAYLAELEDQRAKLDIQIAGIRLRLGLPHTEDAGGASGIRVTGTGTVTGRGVVTGRIRSDEFFGMSIPEAVKAYLAIMKQPQSPSAIVAGLKAGGILTESKNFYTTVWTAIKRLKSNGEILNTKRGALGLSSWYPNRAKGAGDEKKPKKAKKRRKGTKKAQKPVQTHVGVNGSGNGLSGGYRAFLSEQMKAGKSMKEVNEAWRIRKVG